MERNWTTESKGNKRATKTIVCNSLEQAADFANKRAVSLEGGALINNYVNTTTEELIGYKVIPSLVSNLEDVIIYKMRLNPKK